MALTPAQKKRLEVSVIRDQQDFVRRLRAKTWTKPDIDFAIRLAMLIVYIPGSTDLNIYNHARLIAGEIKPPREDL